MQGIGDWALPQQLSDLNNLRLTVKVFCRLAKLIKVELATSQRFQLASRLHPIFQDFAFNFHTFSRSGKVVRKFPDFFKNSRLCTNPAYIIRQYQHRGPAVSIQFPVEWGKGGIGALKFDLPLYKRHPPPLWRKGHSSYKRGK